MRIGDHRWLHFPGADRQFPRDGAAAQRAEGMEALMHADAEDSRRRQKGTKATKVDPREGERCESLFTHGRTKVLAAFGTEKA